MHKLTIGLVAVTAVLLLAVGGVIAYDESTAESHDDAPKNDTAAEWSDWMEQHMEENMGETAAERMQKRMGMSYDEMGEMMNGSNMSSMMENGSEMGCH